MKKRTQKRHKGIISMVPRIGQGQEGEYSIISRTMGRVTSQELAALVMTVKRKVPTGTTIIPRIYTTNPVTAKPLEVRMGKGKGSIDHYVSRVRPNTVILEVRNSAGLHQTVGGVDYRGLLRTASMKLGVSTYIKGGLS